MNDGKESVEPEPAENGKTVPKTLDIFLIFLACNDTKINE